MRNFLAAALLLVSGMGVAVWYLSRRIHRSVFRVTRSGQEPLDLEVLAVDAGTVTVRAKSAGAAAAARQPGVYGLQYNAGYGQVGDIIRDERDVVTREFTLLHGHPPQPGDGARIDSFAYPLDPLVAHSVHWESVDIACADGANPAWLLPGDESRWAILVHGKGARREEALRLIPMLQGDGWTCLAITYRNDAECGQTGRYSYGHTEWEEVEAAVALAAERGARDVLLVGYSMGGGIALSFLQRSPLAHLVRALILDAPMTNLREIVRLRTRRLRVPARLVELAMGRAIGDSGMRWDDVDYHTSWTRHDLPVLLFHGDDDDVIPAAVSDTFAASRANISYYRVPGAGHVRSWNADRARYETAVRQFLAGLRNPVPSDARHEGPAR